jgi:hypothetical protein
VREFLRLLIVAKRSPLRLSPLGEHTEGWQRKIFDILVALYCRFFTVFTIHSLFLIGYKIIVSK